MADAKKNVEICGKRVIFQCLDGKMFGRCRGSGRWFLTCSVIRIQYKSRMYTNSPLRQCVESLEK